MPWPRRLAGTWKMYSGGAISRLTRMTRSSGAALNFRWPNHAMVMKMFEQISSRTVRLADVSFHAACGVNR